MAPVFGGRRGIAVVISVAVAFSLAFAAPVSYGEAYASVTIGVAAASSTSADDAAAAAKAAKAAKKAAKVAAARQKIATASARIAYSRLTTMKSGTGTKYYCKMVKRYAGSYYYPPNNRMQCNVPVVTAIRLSGVDKKFPGSIPVMYKYMKKSKKWKYLGNFNGKMSSLLPGDVLIRVAGVTTYKVNGKKVTVSSNHSCLYVGKKIAKTVYKKYLKGTDADKGSVGSSRVFVNARKAANAPSQRRAACLESKKQANIGSHLLVFRYVG